MKLLTASIIMLLTVPVYAQDMPANTPPTRIPHKGVVTYTGTYALSGGFVGTTGEITITADFGALDINAELTIPSLTPQGGVTSPPEPFSPTGTIVVNSNKSKNASYNLTEGVSFSDDAPFIGLNGSFTGAQARNTTGSFTANFCVPDPPGSNCGGTFVIRSVAGTFTATRQ